MAANPTPQEALLRDRLSQPDVGATFKFQSPLLGFIPDFYCERHRLIVEVDGKYHGFKEAKRRDSRRTAVFRRNGFTVLRFWNGQVESDIESVVEKIRGFYGWDKRSIVAWFAGLPDGDPFNTQS